MKKRPKSIETERLVLKPLEEKDRAAFLRMAKDERVNATYMIPELADEAHENAFFDAMLDFCADEARFVFGIFLKSGEPIGFINDCELEGENAELGYFIGCEHWKCGYATETLSSAIDALFDMGYTRLKAGYFEENAASRRVMEKCGMKPLGIEETLEYKGKTHRCFYMGIGKGR